jgi:hypothetical protein
MRLQGVLVDGDAVRGVGIAGWYVADGHLVFGRGAFSPSDRDDYGQEQ